MNWTNVHAVLVHVKNVDLPKAEEEFVAARAELEAYTKQRGRKPLQMKRSIAWVRVDRLRAAQAALSVLQIGDIVDDAE